MRAIVPARKENSFSHNLFDGFDQIFDNFFEQNLNQKFNDGLSLACDVEETEKFILFSFDLPGLDEKDINIEIKDSVLHVSGERKLEVVDEKSHKFRGRQFGQFMQSFRIPKTINQEQVEADYTNGVLKVLLPKSEVEQPKKVEVKTKKGNFLSELLKAKPES